MDILYEAVIQPLLLSLHLKCLLIVFASRSWWHAVSSIFTLVIRFLGGLDDEVAKKLICAGLRWYDGIHSSYLVGISIISYTHAKGLSYHFWGEWLLPFISFLINYIELGGLSLKYTHYFQFKLCRLTTDTEQFSLYICTPVTKCKSIKELLWVL